MNCHYMSILLAFALNNRSYTIAPARFRNDALIVSKDNIEVCLLILFHNEISIYKLQGVKKELQSKFYFVNDYSTEVQRLVKEIEKCNEEIQQIELILTT